LLVEGWHGKGVINAVVMHRKIPSLRQHMFDHSLMYTSGLESQRFLIALSFGERSLLKASDWVNLQRSGLLHLYSNHLKMQDSELYLLFQFKEKNAV
jgi:competence protein ComEC